MVIIDRSPWQKSSLGPGMYPNRAGAGYHSVRYVHKAKRFGHMVNLKRLFTGSNSAVAMLIAAATGAALFTVIAGALVYGNTRRLISAGGWVLHTQEVIASLRYAALLNERIEYRTRLYLLTQDQGQLDRARANANELSIAALHLKVLVSDNAHQTGNVEGLTARAAELARTLNGFTLVSVLPEIQVQQCQQSISIMTEQEQRLLVDRDKDSQRSSFTSIVTEFIFVAISLLTLMVLFGFLLRDAVLRQRIGKQTMLSNQHLALSVKALEDSASESELLTFSRDELQLCVNVQQVYQSATSSFSRLLPGSNGCLCIINNSRHLVEVVSTWGETGVEDFSPPEVCCGLRSGQLRWRQPGVSEIHCTHFVAEAPDRYLCLPVVAHGNTLGMLYVQCEGDEGVLAVKERMAGLRQLLQLTGMAVASLNLRSKLENQSIRDSLTGLFNRYFMQISLERELSRAARRKQALAVFMLDIDHFKQFNDKHGHAAGDTSLRAIAEVFRNSIRDEDIACRYGGEEFTIILPDVTPEVAYLRAESIRRAVANLRVPLDSEVCGGFSVSIGVALYPRDGETVDLLLQRADQALYRAKRQGRDQVALYAETPVMG